MTNSRWMAIVAAAAMAASGPGARGNRDAARLAHQFPGGKGDVRDARWCR